MKCPTCGCDIATSFCPRCNNKTQPSSRDGSDHVSPDLTSNRADLLRQLLDEDDSKPVARTRLIEHYELDQPLPPRAAGPAESASKRPAVRGKAVPFRTSRSYIAAFIVTAIVMIFVGFIRWYVGTVISLNKAAEIGAKARAEKYANAQKVLADRRKPAKNIADVKTDVTTLPVSARKPAPYVDRIGDWGVSVFDAQIVGNNSTDGERLRVRLRISNYSDRTAVCPNWSRPGDKVLLRDQFGNLYNQIYDPHENRSVPASKSTDDYLSFEAPSMPVGMELDLDIGGSDRPFEFSLPIMFIRRSPPAIAGYSPQKIRTPVPASQQTPPPPVPYDPENDPKFCAEIIVEYNEAIAAMKKRALGMSFDRGVKFRQTEPDRLRKALAKTYKLEGAQIKRILRGL
jgi:hypothetical protein